MAQVSHHRWLGTSVVADKPIGVWAAHECARISGAERSETCDNVHQALAPLRAWGHELVAAGHPDRVDGKAEPAVWRLVAAAEGTRLSYDPEPPAGAPATLGANREALFRADAPFVVRGQDAEHPVYVSALMTGCPTATCTGDTEYVPIVPAEQMVSSAVFTTVPGFKEHRLVVVRARGAAGFEEVRLGCLGAIVDFHPVGREGSYQIATVPLVRDGRAQGACGAGRHELSSRGVFAATVWGWDQQTSYGFTAGARFRALSTISPVPPRAP
jgi:hypothetical protein